MVLIIANSYRKQLFYPFTITKNFRAGHRHFYINSDLLNSRLHRLLLRILLPFASCIVISDKNGGRLLREFGINENIDIYWFCWNTWREAESWELSFVREYPNARLVFLFEKQTDLANQMLNAISLTKKTPIFPYSYSHPLISQLCYVGEVDVADNLVKDIDLNSSLWDLADHIVHRGGEIENNKKLHDLTAEYNIDGDQNLWILKNRIRYLYIKALQRKYGDTFVLVGDNWSELGLKSKPTDFDFDARLRLYSESKVCLDFQSKSTFQSHYPRSAEIVSVSNGLLQLEADDSQQFFGEQTDLRTFNSLETLFAKAESWLNMPDDEYLTLGQSLRQRSQYV